MGCTCDHSTQKLWQHRDSEVSLGCAVRCDLINTKGWEYNWMRESCLSCARPRVYSLAPPKPKQTKGGYVGKEQFSLEMGKVQDLCRKGKSADETVRAF